MSKRLSINLKQKDVEDMYDVLLVGTDGVKVPAIRFFLGLSSCVFKRMLYGRFKENSSREVKMCYSGEILCIIVNCSFGAENTVIPDISDEHTARNIVHLFDCAHFLSMESVENAIIKLVKEAVLFAKGSIRSLIYAIYDEAVITPAANGLKNHIKELLFDDDRSLKEGAVYLREKTLEEMASDYEVKATDFQLLQALLYSRVDASVSNQFTEDFISSIDFSKIDASKLSDVKESGLIPDEILSKHWTGPKK